MIAYEFLMFMIDIPCFILFFITLTFLWRSVMLVKGLSKTKTLDHPAFQRRILVLYNFFNFFVDIPFFLMGMILTVSWRTYNMWNRISKFISHQNQNDTSVRWIIASEFLNFLVDIPFIICGLIISTICLWRAYGMWREIKNKVAMIPFLSFIIFPRRQLENKNNKSSFIILETFSLIFLSLLWHLLSQCYYGEATSLFPT